MTEPMSQPMSQDEVRAAVRDRYASAAQRALTLTEVGSCCGSGSTIAAVDPITIGHYDGEDERFDAAISASLGCGNPTALVALHPGDDVLDLGSGGGLDVLLSARRVGPDGTAYGLDMTDEMLALARRNQERAGILNATFLKGTIEQIPLPDESVDVVISNCVINLSPDKDAVLAEAHRVLRPQGRFAVSDIVALREIPPPLRRVVGLWTGCISGSLRDVEYAEKLTSAGFVDASIEVTRRFDRAALESMADQLVAADVPPGLTLEQVVDALDGAFASAFIRARKP